jgi:hypothetical protein
LSLPYHKPSPTRSTLMNNIYDSGKRIECWGNAFFTKSFRFSHVTFHPDKNPGTSSIEYWGDAQRTSDRDRKKGRKWR